MALPKDRSSIGTNLPAARLKKFLDALDAGECVQVPGSDSLALSSGSCHFTFEGATYSICEQSEVLTAVFLVSADTAFLAAVNDELETEALTAVKARNWEEAAAVDERIKNISRLFAGSAS